MIESFATELDYPIPDELKPFLVKMIVGESEKPVHVTYPVFAISFPLMVYIYNDLPYIHTKNRTYQPASRLSLAGQICNAVINIEVVGRFGQIGFMLYPSAPYYLFHKPGPFYLNKFQSIGALSSLGTDDLLRNLAGCDHPEDRIELLMDFLKVLARLRRPPIDWLDRSLSEILMNDGKVGQKDLAQNVDISERHLRRKFKEVVGVSPKYFCKVVQLNTVFEMMKSSDHGKLHDLALDCGYYDQAHFINDFNRMIGNSPKSFLEGDHAFVKTYLGRRS